MPVLIAFHRYPNEAAIIGRLLAGYGEIEYDFAMCVAASMNDIDTAMKVIFRMRNESQRIDLIDALLRHKCDEAGLAAQYADAFGAVCHCRKIRNQFAHCHWGFDDASLWFINLQDGAAAAGKPTMTMYRAPLRLLEEQETFFDYASMCLRYICYELEMRADTEPRNPYSMPAKRPQPSLRSPF